MEREMSFLILSANSPWTYGMAEAIANKHHTFAVQFYDWRTYHMIKPTWSTRVAPPNLQRAMPVLPSGYAGRLERFFRVYLQYLIRKWCQKLKQASGEYPWVIASEPYNASWVRNVPAEKLVYYNFDDYALYRPAQKDKILEQEKELVERAAITICASHFQMMALKNRHPQKASQIFHFPHGFVKNYLNPQPEKEPKPMTVGYVGNLGDRLDWQLILEVIKASPNVNFVFVGGLDEQVMIEQGNWQATRKRVLAFSHVRHIGKIPSDQVANYYWTFAVNWIPYVVGHPFNQASCPTKIMDGIASGHPILSTDIPECRLYPEWINIFQSTQHAITHIAELLAVPKRDAYEKRLKQLEFAKKQTWDVRSQTLEKLLLNIE
jgi:teichuronic acid biosynthesis glycosyltransferase TuaH